MMDRPELLQRASEYCQRTGLQLGPQLGYGVHGTVFSARNQTRSGRSAVKVHERERFYRRERDVYRRLADEGVDSVLGFDVPRMLNADDELWVIEMTIASPPFVLDFAGAYLDEPPDYPEDVLAEWDRRSATSSATGGPPSRPSCGGSRASGCSWPMSPQITFGLPPDNDGAAESGHKARNRFRGG